MDPVARVLGHIMAHTFGAGLVEIHRFAPWRGVLISEVGGEHAQVIAFIAQVVIDDIKNYRESQLVRGIHKAA